ncbi:uncharacterized protein LOC115627965 [Scaptodrosophila lebanonensis]|uniref:Uncharacterized protein LOC115627965 n=1 Tax=Drosophila lebanonensis TaxID=7225 RepID=A0A6J2TUF7_DROLE|nr:uncharacterized protein LOC115627965 [Scaptodrosophila lebanonensis]
MQLQKLLLTFSIIFALIIAHHSQITEAKRLIFYNRVPKVQKGQLLVTHPLSKPCPQGKMRDHRGRCRRAIIFVRD